MTPENKHRILIENEEVRLLISDVGGVDPKTGFPYGVKPVSDSDRIKLRTIAGRVLSQGRIYTREQVLSLLERQLNISRQRAVNGFEMMTRSGVLLFQGIEVRLVS